MTMEKKKLVNGIRESEKDPVAISEKSVGC